MSNIIYRIRLINGQDGAWKHYHNDVNRLKEIRIQLWKRYAKIMDAFDSDKSKIELLFQQMKIDDRRYFEIQECVEKINIQDFLPDIEFIA